MNVKPITFREFREISRLVYNTFGINLNDAKRNLVNGRLSGVLRKSGYRNFSEYIEYLKNEKTGNALSEMINRVSTNHTYFMREKSHFEFFRNNVLPEIIETGEARGERDLRIWSAGCSSGEEAYTLGIFIKEALAGRNGGWSAGVLATDISARVLEKAVKGVYSSEAISKLPPMLRHNYFHRVQKDVWRIEDSLKKEIVFRRFNLMNKKFPFKKTFQIIFCRNVMIYFDTETKKELVKKFYDSTEKGGYLFIGHSETLGREDCPYTYIMPAVYRKI
jgi:chemotaxis protein methyltransferase CheR